MSPRVVAACRRLEAFISPPPRLLPQPRRNPTCRMVVADGVERVRRLGERPLCAPLLSGLRWRRRPARSACSTLSMTACEGGGSLVRSHRVLIGRPRRAPAHLPRARRAPLLLPAAPPALGTRVVRLTPMPGLLLARVGLGAGEASRSSRQSAQFVRLQIRHARSSSCATGLQPRVPIPQPAPRLRHLRRQRASRSAVRRVTSGLPSCPSLLLTPLVLP